MLKNDQVNAFKLSGMAVLALLCTANPVHGQQATDADERAADLADQMAGQEKHNLLHGILAMPVIPGTAMPEDSPLGSGYVPGVSRLGIPHLAETDAGLGVAYHSGIRGDGATALPAATAMAASFDTELVERAGRMIGGEARAKGFNVMLAGGINLARDPRNGRTFEYFSEDPLLSGILGAASVRGIQSNGIISTLKHFAFNSQETGRHVLDVRISDAAGRESDLLAFELAIDYGNPGSVMCAYNGLNGEPTCSSDYLLNQVLKRDWAYPGFVMSDWGSTPGPEAALAGLDHQSGAQIDPQIYFGETLAQLAQSDPRYAQRVEDMNRRILRSMIVAGLLDEERTWPRPIDFEANAELAQEVAQQGIVLLRNRGNALPLADSAGSILVVGGYADLGVMSGNGSSQVMGQDGPAASIPMGDLGPLSFMRAIDLHRSVPLKAIRDRAGAAIITFNDGRYPQSAAREAAKADVVIVFATQWMMEGYDVPSLSLPSGQDELIAAVAGANPNTLVVLETGGPVLMPWLDQTAAVLQAWYPGARGAEAIAAVLFGDVNPSGRLPLTFPRSLDDLPRPQLDGADTLVPSFSNAENRGQTVIADYEIDGADIGYRWFANRGIPTLFPFGFGMSYTSFETSNLQLTAGSHPAARVTVRNTGGRAGGHVVQVYTLDGPANIKRRLVGFGRVELDPGEAREVHIPIEPRLMANWDSDAGQWVIPAGSFTIAVANSAEDMGISSPLVMQRRVVPAGLN